VRAPSTKFSSTTSGSEGSARAPKRAVLTGADWVSSPSFAWRSRLAMSANDCALRNVGGCAPKNKHERMQFVALSAVPQPSMPKFKPELRMVAGQRSPLDQRHSGFVAIGFSFISVNRSVTGLQAKIPQHTVRTACFVAISSTTILSFEQYSNTAEKRCTKKIVPSASLFLAPLVRESLLRLQKRLLLCQPRVICAA
jgi:hypothetical protein